PGPCTPEQGGHPTTPPTRNPPAAASDALGAGHSNSSPARAARARRGPKPAHPLAAGTPMGR
ncbi:MAG: hypothetical protein ACK5N0_04320, partial [Synechococcaceae cyanobacterium]